MVTLDILTSYVLANDLTTTAILPQESEIEQPSRYLPGAFSNDPPAGSSYCNLLEDLTRSEGDKYTQ
jgi:hypothetical protein